MSTILSAFGYNAQNILYGILRKLTIRKVKGLLLLGDLILSFILTLFFCTSN